MKKMNGKEEWLVFCDPITGQTHAVGYTIGTGCILRAKKEAAAKVKQLFGCRMVVFVGFARRKLAPVQKFYSSHAR